jgi:hypothetical protein
MNGREPQVQKDALEIVQTSGFAWYYDPAKKNGTKTDIPLSIE